MNYNQNWQNYKSIIIKNDPQHAEDIDILLNLLHEEQLGMIDRAVDVSDLSQARELINYIKSL